MAGQNTIKLLLLSLFMGIGGLAVFLRHQDDGIRQYTVTRPKPTHRMLGAIIPNGERAWFLKLSGPIAAVDAQYDAFRDVIQNTQFSADGAATPVFKLPAGWTQEPGGEMRFATLKIQSVDTPLECTVSVLPINDPDLAAYLLANINRWRDQMRLRKLSKEELSSATAQIAFNSPGLTATFVDLAGFSSSRTMGSRTMGPGPAVGGAGRPEAPLAGRAGATSPAEKLTYTTPEGWTPGQLQVSRMGVTVSRLAAFEVHDGDRRVEITVTKLTASAALVNVNRWRSQIGLDEMTVEQFRDSRQDLDFAGTTADYVQFFGVEQAILGVIAIRGNTAWFVKLQGDPDLAGRERQKFEEFVRSIRL